MANPPATLTTDSTVSVVLGGIVLTTLCGFAGYRDRNTGWSQQMTDTRKGACVCGAVTFEADVAEPHYLACHCATCRRWSGPAMVVTVSELRIDDGAPVKTYDSSDYGHRGFCADCGTHLFWKMKDDSMIHLLIGSLENSDDLQLGVQIFIDSKPAHYAFANDTKTMTGAEVFASATGEG